MYADTATRFANCNVVEQQQVEWQRRFEAQLQQNAEWIGELPFQGQGQFQLEQDVTGRIQQFCAAAAMIDAVTGCSYEGAVEYIAVTGPFDIPSDFTVIEIPSLDTMPQYRKQSISDITTTGSAIVYTTVQRPTTADMCAFLQPDTSVYSVSKAMPIAVGYFSDAVITANARGTTAAINFTAIGRTTAAAAAALHAASIVDNEDTHLVQLAMYTAVEQVVTINSESERSALAACIDNIVLFDRTVLVKDRKVCHKVYEQVRYATSSSTLLQWCGLLSRFCARANGFSAKQILLNGTKTATRYELQDSIRHFLLHLRGINASSSGADVSQDSALLNKNSSVKAVSTSKVAARIEDVSAKLADAHTALAHIKEQMQSALSATDYAVMMQQLSSNPEECAVTEQPQLYREAAKLLISMKQLKKQLDELTDQERFVLSLRGTDESSSGAGIAQEFEQFLYKAVESSSAEAVTAAVQWADLAYTLALKDFAKQVACTLRQAFAIAAATSNTKPSVQAAGGNSNSDSTDVLSMYLQACARDQVTLTYQTLYCRYTIFYVSI
jgi:hypothetical protein